MTPAEFRQRFGLTVPEATALFRVERACWYRWERAGAWPKGPAGQLARLLEARPEMVAVLREWVG